MNCIFAPLLSLLLLLGLGFSAYSTPVIEELEPVLGLPEVMTESAQAEPVSPLAQPGQLPQQQTERTLIIGQPAQGQIIEGGTGEDWVLSGTEGDLILIDMRAASTDGLDCYLTLLDPDGFDLVSDDDSGMGVNARIGPMRLPTSGNYTVQASAYSGGGLYTIEARSLSTLPVLEIGQPVSGTLGPDHPSDVFLLPAVTPGEMLSVMAREDGGQIRPVFDLYSLDGLLASTEYDGGSSLDPIIPQEGETYVVILSWDGYSDSGPYEITLTPSEVVLFAPGTTQSGQLDVDHVSSKHFFEAQAGQVLQLTARIDSGLSIALDITSADAMNYVFSGSGESTRALAVEFEIPATTIYRIEVRDGSYSGETGSYTLTLVDASQ